MEPGHAVVSLDVRCDRAAPVAVRDALRGVEGLGWVLGDAMLIASELVTNAVLHSGGRPEERLQVRISRTEDRLLIAVRDPGTSGGFAAVTEKDWGSSGGFGLRVVDALATRWGTERDPGYLVWAELALD